MLFISFDVVVFVFVSLFACCLFAFVVCACLLFVIGFVCCCLCVCFFVCVVCVVSLCLLLARLSFARLCDCVLVRCCLIIFGFIRSCLLFVVVFS